MLMKMDLCFLMSGQYIYYEICSDIRAQMSKNCLLNEVVSQ